LPPPVGTGSGEIPIHNQTVANPPPRNSGRDWLLFLFVLLVFIPRICGSPGMGARSLIVVASGLLRRPSFESVGRTPSVEGGSGPAARRPARGVPQASLASGSLPHLSHRGGDNEHPASGLSERQSRPIVLLGRHVMPLPRWRPRPVPRRPGGSASNPT
jgi:hypothetical protein